MLHYLFLAILILFSMILGLFIMKLVMRKISLFEKPPIKLPAFLAAKICAFLSCLFIPAGILWPELKVYSTPEWVSVWALLPFTSGIIIAIGAMKKLGDDLVFGLPESNIHSLKIDGIFKLSRNPLYLGFILIILASCLLTPNPVNFAAAGVAIFFHHLIILREEDYLQSRLGAAYREYMKTTGRYLLNI